MCFTSSAVHDLRNRTTVLRGPDSVERVFGLALVEGERRFDVALHLSNGQVILEAEPTVGNWAMSRASSAP